MERTGSDARAGAGAAGGDRSDLPPALAAALEDLLLALRAEAGLARTTLEAYRRDLERFLRRVAARGKHSPAAVTAEDVVDHLAARRAAGAAEATVARDLVSIRLLFAHLVREGALGRDPTRLLRAPVLERALPTCLDVEEVERLLAAPGGDSWIDLRDRALLEVLYATGARVSEAVRLRTDDLEPSLRVLRLLGKGDKMRLVPVGERARRALAEWIEGPRLGLPGARGRPEVFLTRTGRPLSRVDAWRRVQAAARRAGLPGKVSPHVLRHSFASHLIAGGADLRSVQEMLGHASIRTTEVYTHLDAEHVRGLFELYHPRA